MSNIKETTLTPAEQILITRLKSFRVPVMAKILEAQLKDPNADLSTFMERISAMVDSEWQARADKRFNRLMKEAHLRYPAADLDETIYRPERQLDTQTIERLSTCHWIEEGKKPDRDRFFCKREDLSDQCFLRNGNEAVKECQVHQGKHPYG